MRNLKKFLALVLALMMTFSLMVTANAAIDTNAAVTDKDSITEEFKEAVAVLNGLKIITGYEDGTFRPDKSISRQEATALVYRLHSGDADNVKKDLYSTADNIAKFKDVNPNGGQQWSAGYIGYCANQEIIKGVGADRFNPTGNVTGYQMLAMVLRAIGYGQRGEYEGSGWQTRVATTATQLGMLKNIDDTNYAGTLSAPATRELVAEIVFQAALLKQVIWNDAFGYVSKNQITGLELKSLGVEKFNLNCGNYTVIDKWGRPGYQWFKGSSAIATIKAQPVKTYDTTVRECDVAHDLGIATNATYSLYVNDKKAITDNYLIEATDTVTRVGGQGRITEFYGNLTNEHNGSTWSKSVVMIDTYLATVTKVTERVVDPAGHVIVPAYLYLDVYDGQAVGVSDKTTAYNAANSTRNTSEHRAERSGSNWEYAVGDKVLVQGYTDKQQSETGTNVSGLNHIDPVTANQNSVEANNKAAFETNRLIPATTGATKYDNAKNVSLEVVQKSTPVLGKQTVTYWNQGKHTVDGKDYNDQMTLFLDVAGTTTNTTYAWYFDTKGNLIGIDYVPNTVNYGVITSIYSAFGQGDSSTDGTAKAIANVLYADGTTGTVTIDRFLMSGAVATGHGAAGTAMTVKVGNTAATNSVELVPVYDNDNNKALAASGRTVTNTPDEVLETGWLHVAPVINVNATEKGVNNGANNYFGVLKGNMFKFVSGSDGGMTAIEVAGAKDAAHANENTGVYEWNYNDTPTAGMIYKNFSYVALNSADANRQADIWMDAGTKIMVNDGTDAQNVKCYTLATLPGNVNFGTSEIDWSDPDGDGRADYIYVTGTIEGTTTYGLFYYNGGAAQWNGAEKKGTMFGWLNGEPTTIEFDDETEFNIIRNSQAYKGHLFALQLTNGVVSNVMGAGSNTNHKEWLVTDENQAPVTALLVNTIMLSTAYANNGVSTVSGTAADNFGVGFVNEKNGNPYTDHTKIVYMNDVTGTPGAGEANVSYDSDKRVVNDGTDDYYLTPNTKVIGLGMGVNQDTAILEYLNKSTTNDVTIVYEEGQNTNSVKSIVEIYVATDPNVTPGGETPTASNKPAGVSTVPSGVTGANVENIIKNMGPNTVVYSPTVKGATAGTSDAEDVLYFPFNVSAADKGATLTINKVNANGSRSLAFQEVVAAASGSFTVGGHFFVINFNGGPVNTTTTTYQSTLTEGAYEFTIVDSLGTTLSSGSFRIVVG